MMYIHAYIFSFTRDRLEVKGVILSVYFFETIVERWIWFEFIVGLDIPLCHSFLFNCMVSRVVNPC